MAKEYKRTGDPRQSYILDMLKKMEIRFPVAELVEKLGIPSGNVSDTLNGKRAVSDAFFKKFCEAYDLDGDIKPSSPGDTANRERAMLRMLYQRVAKIEAERLGIPVDRAMREMDDDTMIAWRELEQP